MPYSLAYGQVDGGFFLNGGSSSCVNLSLYLVDETKQKGQPRRNPSLFSDNSLCFQIGKGVDFSDCIIATESQEAWLWLYILKFHKG